MNRTRITVAILGALLLPTVHACGFIERNCTNLGEPCPGDTPVADSSVDVGNAEAAIPCCGDAGVDAIGKDGDSNPSCNFAKRPDEDPCVIDDAVGIFVAPSGDDANAGSKSAPVKTLGVALTKATAASKRVYACAGTYTEQVAIAGRAEVFGGFTCPGAADAWAYDAAGAKRAVIVGGAPEHAVKIEATSAAVVLADIDVRGADATAPGQTSVAVLIKSSSSVTLRKVNVVAGSGANGSPGANGAAAPNYVGANAPSGNNAPAGSGGAVQTNTCQDGTSSSGGPGGLAAGNGTPGQPRHTPSTGLGGDSLSACAGPGSGGDGANGPAGGGGAAATSLGTFVANLSRWTPAAGADGINGKPGQGGGGGAGKGGGGGGGGAGGCGGTGGRGGSGGGASFGLLAISSKVTLSQATIAGGQAGDGGKGGDGQASQAGGGTGTGQGIPTGCSGGGGGAGGGGGSGQGGAGGLSVAIAYVGEAPAADAASTVTAFARKATAGVAGTPGAGTGNAGGQGTKGVDGDSRDLLSLPTQ